MKTLLKALLFLVVANYAAGDHYSELVRQADTVKITYFEGDFIKSVFVSDAGWLDSVAKAVDGAVGSSKNEACFCISLPKATFLRNGKEILSLSVHHGNGLRCYCAESSLSGDFAISEQVGKRIELLFMQKIKSSQPSEPTR